MAELAASRQAASLFDELRHLDKCGEHWFAREICEPLTYTWRGFTDAIERGRIALRTNGQDPDMHIQEWNKPSNGFGRGATQTDYRMTREGVYATIQGADPRKSEIAAAWAYFRTKTKQAETFDREPMDELELAERYRDLADRQIVLIKEKRVALARAEKAEGFKRAIEAGNGLMLRAFHKKYFSLTPERVFFEHLYANGYLIDQRGKGGKDPRTGKLRDGSQHRHPSAKGKPWFYLHTSTDQWGDRHENTRVRPGDPELDLRDTLAREGLMPNEVPTGLFELEAA